MAIDRIGGPRSFGPGGLDEPGRKARSDGAEPKPSDSLDLSSAARRTAALADRARELPEVRQERVDTVRRSFDDGTYGVDPRRVARAILEIEDAVRSR